MIIKMAKSTTDVAYELLGKKKKEVSFSKLWDEVSQTMGFTTAQADNKIANFYSDMMLDKRFVSLPENMWDLRQRHKFDEVHIELDSIVLEDDDDENEENDSFDEEDEDAGDENNEEAF